MQVDPNLKDLGESLESAIGAPILVLELGAGQGAGQGEQGVEWQQGLTSLHRPVYSVQSVAEAIV